MKYIIFITTAYLSLVFFIMSCSINKKSNIKHLIIYDSIKVVELRTPELIIPGMSPAMYRLDFKKLIYVESFTNTNVHCYE